jgi:hypothetical protein
MVNKLSQSGFWQFCWPWHGLVVPFCYDVMFRATVLQWRLFLWKPQCWRRRESATVRNSRVDDPSRQNVEVLIVRVEGKAQHRHKWLLP